MQATQANVAIAGEVTITRRRNGVIVEQRTGHNVVVNQGLAWLAGQLVAGTGGIFSMRCGQDGSTPTDPYSTTNLLNVPTGSLAKVFTGPQITYPAAVTGQYKVQFGATWNEGENVGFTIAEVGLFVTGPLLFARYVVPGGGIVKLSNETLTIDYVITLTAS